MFEVMMLIKTLFFPDREEKVVGSYGPRDDAYEWVSKPADIVPSGMMFRGSYSATTVVLDDDGRQWLSFEQKFSEYSLSHSPIMSNHIPPRSLSPSSVLVF